MMITAKEAREMAIKATKKNDDISKTQTIMKNIKSRAEKGLTYFEYQAHINYSIAKTLYENGFRLLKKDRELFLDDFKNNNTFVFVRILWGE